MCVVVIVSAVSRSLLWIQPSLPRRLWQRSGELAAHFVYVVMPKVKRRIPTIWGVIVRDHLQNNFITHLTMRRGCMIAPKPVPLPRLGRALFGVLHGFTHSRETLMIVSQISKYSWNTDLHSSDIDPSYTPRI